MSGKPRLSVIIIIIITTMIMIIMAIMVIIIVVTSIIMTMQEISGAKGMGIRRWAEGETQGRRGQGDDHGC